MKLGCGWLLYSAKVDVSSLLGVSNLHLDSLLVLVSVEFYVFYWLVFFQFIVVLFLVGFFMSSGFQFDSTVILC